MRLKLEFGVTSTPQVGAGGGHLTKMEDGGGRRKDEGEKKSDSGHLVLVVSTKQNFEHAFPS